jgi:hypothetical protein
MTDDIRLFDVVRIRDGIPEEGVPPGTHAAVIEILDEEAAVFEVEVVDADGMTTFVGVVRDVQLQLVHRPRQ